MKTPWSPFGKALLKNELFWLNLLTWLFISVFTLFSSTVLHIVLGLPFVLFLPGYVLVSALYPRQSILSGAERVILSFALSVAVVPLIGLALNFTSWGINLYPVLIGVAVFILAASVIAGFRRYRLPAGERFEVAWRFNWLAWLGADRRGRVVNIVVGVSILLAVSSLVYAIAASRLGEKYTEFYILGLSGKAADYPTRLKVGEEGKVLLNIVNHEQQEVSYRVEVTVSGVKNREVGPIVLQIEEKREQEISFVPEASGEKQKVEFVLLMDGEPYHTLHLWVDVVE